jgi:hypothetical protein
MGPDRLTLWLMLQRQHFNGLASRLGRRRKITAEASPPAFS